MALGGRSTFPVRTLVYLGRAQQISIEEKNNKRLGSDGAAIVRGEREKKKKIALQLADERGANHHNGAWVVRS